MKKEKKQKQKVVTDGKKTPPRGSEKKQATVVRKKAGRKKKRKETSTSMGGRDSSHELFDKNNNNNSVFPTPPTIDKSTPLIISDLAQEAINAIKKDNQEELGKALKKINNETDIIKLLCFKIEGKRPGLENILGVAIFLKRFRIIGILLNRYRQSYDNSEDSLFRADIIRVVIGAFKEAISGYQDHLGHLNSVKLVLQYFKKEMQTEASSGFLHPVIYAVRAQRYTIVQHLLTEGFNAKESDQEGNTPLTAAVALKARVLKYVKLLVGSKALINMDVYRRAQNNVSIKHVNGILEYFLNCNEECWEVGEKQKVQKNPLYLLNPKKRKRTTSSGLFDYQPSIQILIATKIATSTCSRKKLTVNDIIQMILTARPSETISLHEYDLPAISPDEWQEIECFAVDQNVNLVGYDRSLSVANLAESSSSDKRTASIFDSHYSSFDVQCNDGAAITTTHKLNCNELIIRIMSCLTDTLDLSQNDVSSILPKEWKDIKILLEDNRYSTRYLYFGNREADALIQENELQDYIKKMTPTLNT